MQHIKCLTSNKKVGKTKIRRKTKRKNRNKSRKNSNGHIARHRIYGRKRSSNNKRIRETLKKKNRKGRIILVSNKRKVT